MSVIKTLGLLLIFIASSTIFATPAGPLENPVEKDILLGDIAVTAVNYIRMPHTKDAEPEGANAAYARIQYMNPLGDSNGSLVVNDLRGLIYIINSKTKKFRTYLDLRQQKIDFDDSMFANETGLASVAFHPDFYKKGTPGYGKLYTAYSAAPSSGTPKYQGDNDESHHSIIREWTTNKPAAAYFEGTSRELLRVGQFSPSHNIGTMAFNPNANTNSSDYGLLYVSFGDGGGANDPYSYGQSLKVPSAAIIRINPLQSGIEPYTIPADNPFVNRKNVATEIWAYGLRHAQQFSWDRGGDGRMFIADIGQNQIEEVNIGVSGGNYGWSLREGTFATGMAYKGAITGPVYPRPEIDSEPYIYPVAQYDHPTSSAIGSGFVYRGSAIPSLYGKYIFADIVQAKVFYIDTDNLNPGKPTQIKELRVQINSSEKSLLSLSGFPNTYWKGKRGGLRLGIDQQGELYLLTKGDGWIRKLVNK